MGDGGAQPSHISATGGPGSLDADGTEEVRALHRVHERAVAAGGVPLTGPAVTPADVERPRDV